MTPESSPRINSTQRQYLRLADSPPRDALERATRCWTSHDTNRLFHDAMPKHNHPHKPHRRTLAGPQELTDTPSMPPSGPTRPGQVSSQSHLMGSSTHSSTDTSVLRERVFIGASYLDIPQADADFHAIRRLRVALGAPRTFDAVTIGRKASGETRFHRESVCPEDSTGDDRAAPGLAAGLGAALFPSVAADIPAARVSERKTLGKVAGIVAIALGRSGIAELGAHLDASAAGLIVAAEAHLQDRILATLTKARSTIARSAAVDTGTVEHMGL